MLFIYIYVYMLYIYIYVIYIYIYICYILNIYCYIFTQRYYAKEKVLLGPVIVSMIMRYAL